MWAHPNPDRRVLNVPDTENNVGHLDTEDLLWMLGAIVHRVGELNSWQARGNPERMSAALVALRDALLRFAPADENNDAETNAKKVLAAFDNDAQPWVQAGVPASRYLQWAVFGFNPKDAAAWERAGVPIEYALHFRGEKFDPQWWPTWQQVHDLAVDDPLPLMAQMFHLVRSAHTLKLGPSKVNQWVEAGVRVDDIPVWFQAGYTPAKARAAMKKGVTVTQAAEQAAPIPGPTWTKVASQAKEAGWVLEGTQMVNDSYEATWKHPGGSHARALFSHRGEFGSGRIFGPTPGRGTVSATIKDFGARLAEVTAKKTRRSPGK
jgi:hypothetical protein